MLLLPTKHHRIHQSKRHIHILRPNHPTCLNGAELQLHKLIEISLDLDEHSAEGDGEEGPGVLGGQHLAEKSILEKILISATAIDFETEVALITNQYLLHIYKKIL